MEETFVEGRPGGSSTRSAKVHMRTGPGAGRSVRPVTCRRAWDVFAGGGREPSAGKTFLRQGIYF